ncbi:MAG: aminopeptidase [Candidatus Nanoarchaeia archaeon]|jgi:hypothetical protein
MVNLEERIALARDVKRFAVEELGISPNPSFKRVEEDNKKSRFYGVYCSYKDRIESAAGRMGFIRCDNRADWENVSAKWEKAGFDIFAVTWEALSSSVCPITKFLLKAPKHRLVYVILHENSHIHESMNGFNLPYNIDEALACSFGLKGSRLYFSAHAPHMNRVADKQRNNKLSFFDKINHYVSLANESYGRSFEEGRAVLEKADTEIRSFWNLPGKKLNNAYLLSFIYYSEKTKIVWERLKDIHPREYMTNKDLLYEKLAGLLPPKAE